MKKLLLCLCGMAIIGPGWAQSSTEKIGELLNKQAYFELKRELDKTDGSEVNPIIWHIAKAFTGTYFNRPEEAMPSIGALLSSYQDQIGPDNIIGMLSLLVENYTNQRDYAKAAELCGSLADQFASSAELAESFSSGAKLYAELAGVPAQQVEKSTGSVRFQRDQAGLVTVPVTDSKGNDSPFILDTGAGYSIIPESRAADFNLKMVADSVYVVGGVAGTWSKIGVAETVTIGDVRLRNVIFCVLPDSTLSVEYNGKNRYDLGGLIGWDVIRAFDNLVFDNSSGTLSFNVPMQTPPAVTGNLMAAGLHPYIEVMSGTDRLVFDMDTGANVGMLTYRYGQQYPNRIAGAASGTVQGGGIGGVTSEKVYQLSNFPLTVGAPRIIPSIEVLAGEDWYYSNQLSVPVDGVLGQNIIQLYDRMIIDIPTMSVTLE